MSKNRIRILIILGEIAVILVLAIVILMPKTPYTSMGMDGGDTFSSGGASGKAGGASGKAGGASGKAGGAGSEKAGGAGSEKAGAGESATESSDVYVVKGDVSGVGDVFASGLGKEAADGAGNAGGTGAGNAGGTGVGNTDGTGVAGGPAGAGDTAVNPDLAQDIDGSTIKTTLSGSVVEEAQLDAAMYDYDAAIEKLKAVSGYETNEELKNKVKEYETEKEKLVKWEDNTRISHLFVHSLIVDTARAFRKGSSQPVGYNRYMTTVGEFKDMLESLYEKGYVLVSMHDIAERYTDEDGVEKLRKKPIYLPEGKMPFVLSQDDVNYYAYMDNDGFADRLVIGEDGRPTCQYTDTEGNVSYGEYDVLPIVDNFLLKHPDFSYRGAKGILAVTGYEGALGYDTGWHMYDLNNPDEAAKLKKEQEAATAVADAIKADGWEFASHSYTHTDMKKNSYEKVIYDTDKWEREVQPILGDTDLYIYPFGSDICDWRGYKGDKFEYLKKAGFWYFCNVDASRYWIQITDKYMRMGRINADGERMVKTPQKLDYFFDSAEILDKSRPKLE
ncbi:MAG: polysaccharide deacetylase family protein [Lachnospiraceae bacterium]|nr:polysaccharide deacetylase family protein [Lachnospiraceae bacterium]